MRHKIKPPFNEIKNHYLQQDLVKQSRGAGLAGREGLLPVDKVQARAGVPYGEKSSPLPSVP